MKKQSLALFCIIICIMGMSLPLLTPEVKATSQERYCFATGAPTYLLGSSSGGSYLDTQNPDFVYHVSASASYIATSTNQQKLPGTGADDSSVGSTAWVNPGRITAQDLSYATCTGSDVSAVESHYLKGTTSGNLFTLPSTASITGVLAEIYKKATYASGVVDEKLYLVKGGSPTGNNKASASYWSTTAGWVSYGGSDNLASYWNVALTYNDVNAANFGLVLQAYIYAHSPAPNVANVDAYRMTVYYNVVLYHIDFYYAMQFTDAPRASVTQLAWELFGYSTIAGTRIYVYNWTSSSWYDTTYTMATSWNGYAHTVSAANFMDSSGNMRIRCNFTAQSATFSVYIDLLLFWVTYTPTTVPPVNMISPAEMAYINTNSVNLTWSGGGAYVASYDVELATNESFTADVQSFNQVPSFKAIGSLASGTYYWHVRAKDSYGAIGNWTVRRFNVIIGTPAAPTLVNPGNSTITDPYIISFSWLNSSSPYIAYYHIQVSTDPAFSSFYLNQTTYSSSYLINTTTPLLYQWYYWRVRAVDLAGNLGSWSTVKLFFPDTTLSISYYGLDGWGIPFEFPKTFINGTQYSTSVIPLPSVYRHVNITTTDYFNNIIAQGVYQVNFTTVQYLNIQLELVSITLQSWKMTVCNITYAGQPVKTLKFMDSITTILKPATYTFSGIANNGSAFQGNPMTFNKVVAITATSTTVTLVVPPLEIASISFSASDTAFSYAIASSKPSTTWFKIYDNLTLIVPKTYALSGIWTKSTVYGYHNLTFNVGDNDGYAYNFTNSYFVDYRHITFEFYSTLDGLGLDSNLFQVYVNGSRVWDLNNYATTGSHVLLQVFDYYMNSIYSGVLSYSSVIQVGLGYYQATFANNGENNVILNATSDAYALHYAGTNNDACNIGATSLTQFTFGYWLYWDDSSAFTYQHYLLLSPTGGSGQVVSLYTVKASGYTSWFMGGPELYAVPSSASIQLNTWYLVTFTYNGTYAKSYFNGIFVDQTAIALTLSDPNILPGGYVGGRIGGSISGVFIFKRVLSGSEILQIYQRKMLPDTNQLYLYWLLNEGSGSSAYDLSGNGFILTVSSSMWTNYVNPGFAPVKSIPVSAQGSTTFRMIAKGYSIVGYGVRIDSSLVQFTSTTITVPSSSNVYTFHDLQYGPVYITYKNQAGHTLIFDEFNTTIYTPSLGWVKLGTENIITVLLSESITVTVRDLFGNLISNATYSYPGIRLIIQIPVYSITVANNDEVHASYVSFYPIWLNSSQYTYPVNDSKWILKSDHLWPMLAGNYTLRVYYPSLGPFGTMLFYNLTITADYGMYVTNNATIDLYTAYGQLTGSIQAIRVDVQDKFSAVVNQYTSIQDKQQVLEDLNKATQTSVDTYGGMIGGPFQAVFYICIIFIIFLAVAIGAYLNEKLKTVRHDKEDEDRANKQRLHGTPGHNPKEGGAPKPSYIRDLMNHHERTRRR